MKPEEFEAKYKKPENKFFLLEVSKPIYNRENPKDHRTYWVKTSIQIVVQKDGTLAGREV